MSPHCRQCAPASAGNVSLLNNVVVTPFHVPPATPYGLPTCCEPVPNFVAVWATAVDGLTAAGNCVAPAPPGQGNMSAVFVATPSVSGDFAGGVVLCGDGTGGHY